MMKMNFLRPFRRFSTIKEEPLIIKTLKNNVVTLTMNRSDRLNAWTKPMLLELVDSFHQAANDNDVKVLVLTGKGKYFCAGVDLAGTLKPDHPQKVWNKIKEENQKLFETFLDFPKPILVAVNGHAIGASVTSATLCDGIIASENASFLTPFNRLGIPPEGCSSVHFDRIMNKDLAYKMLHEDLQVYSHQAKEAGFVLDVVPESKLQFRAQQIAEEWILMNKKRIVAPDLKQVNEKESELLATAFLSPPFLYGQYKFLRSKGKIQLALIFWLLSLTQPLWSMLLQKRK